MLVLVVNQTITLVIYPYAKYWIYATNWGQVLMTLTLICDAILVLMRYKVQERLHNKSNFSYDYENCDRFLLKISVALTSVAYPWVLTITVIYYMALFDFSVAFVLTWESYCDIWVHFILTVLAILDTIVSSRPWTLWHTWFVAFCGMVYMIFNATYILVFNGTGSKGQEYIYSLLDWKNDMETCVYWIFAAIFGFPLAFLFFYLIAMLRDYCWKTYYKSDHTEESDDIGIVA